MISSLNTADSKNQNWLSQFWIDFRRRFISLLGYQFRKFSPQLALGVLHNTNIVVQIDKSKLIFKIHFISLLLLKLLISVLLLIL